MQIVHLKLDSGKRLQAFSCPSELQEELRLLRQLSERQTSVIITLQAKLALARGILKERGFLGEFLAQVGEEEG